MIVWKLIPVTGGEPLLGLGRLSIEATGETLNPRDGDSCQSLDGLRIYTSITPGGFAG